MAGLSLWLRRVAAELLDAAVLLPVWLPVVLLLRAIGVPVLYVPEVDVEVESAMAALIAQGGAGYGAGGLAALVLLLVLAPYVIGAMLGYRPMMMARSGNRNGQTLGRQAAGVRVVRTDGKPIGYRRALVREGLVQTLLFVVPSYLFLWIPLALDLLWPLWDPEGRAVHDHLAGTRVVRA